MQDCWARAGLRHCLYLLPFSLHLQMIIFFFFLLWMACLTAGQTKSKPFKLWPKICHELGDCSIFTIQNKISPRVAVRINDDYSFFFSLSDGIIFKAAILQRLRKKTILFHFHNRIQTLKIQPHELQLCSRTTTVNFQTQCLLLSLLILFPFLFSTIFCPVTLHRNSGAESLTWKGNF